MKKLALFRAERGISLALLERLMGSSSLAGALKSLYMLRTLSLAGVAIVLLWSLSPVGGQASLRLMTTANRSSTASIPLRYLDSSDAATMVTSFESGDSAVRAKQMIDALYVASILAPDSVQSSRMDIWGNLKIPSLESLNSSSLDGNGWVSIPKGRVLYSSLIGLPVVGLLSEGKSSFAIESSYMFLDCPDVSKSDKLIEFQNDCPASNSSCYIGTNTTYGRFSSFQFGSNTASSGNTSITTPREIVFAIGEGQGGVFTIAKCTLTMSYVESRVGCDGKNCAVVEMRKSRMNHTSPAFTPLYIPPIFSNFVAGFSYVDGPNPGTGGTTMTEDFISNTSIGGGGGMSLYSIPRDLFTSRLNLAFNTYWLPSLGFTPTAFAGNLPTNFNLSNFFDALNTTATITTSQERYVCDRAWLSILLISASILFVTGLVGYILDYMSKSPDILGYMSTLTRDSPYMDLPSGGTALDGDERARLLKDVQLTVADVDWSRDVGHIALSTLRDSPAKMARSEKGRLFR
ncbi:hypothetical protein FGG08_005972 [Glutinoglossum americanum]|uniref:Uncharacterized protein n=1 Tax=Glutinoglossum americanum TaxID=1670608 RepID=A0A9P8I1Y7_9PEZI|nr:hypothetical protein FGG08_005972 [Glutinoglossum americanum]